MAAVFNGDSSLNNINQTHIRTCAILACKNGDTKSCGQRYELKFLFGTDSTSKFLIISLDIMRQVTRKCIWKVNLVSREL